MDDVKRLDLETVKSPEVIIEVVITAVLFTYSFCILALCA